MEEIWKDIPGYEGIYQASNTGKIKSLERIVESLYPNGTIRKILRKERIMRTRVTRGYNVVGLQDKYTSVHRLLALTFIPNPENLPQINHIDGNSLNNNLNNLEWVTAQRNVEHSYELGLADMNRLKIMGFKKSKPVYQIDSLGQIVARHPSLSKAADVVKGDISAIAHVCNGKYPTYKRFTWQFADQPLQSREHYKDIFKKSLLTSEGREHRAKMLAAMADKASKAVKQVSMDGEIINTFKSFSEAARYIDGNATGVRCVTSGRYKTYKGFKWELA